MGKIYQKNGNSLRCSAQHKLEIFEGKRSSIVSFSSSFLPGRSLFSEEGTPFTLFEKGSGQWYRKIRTNLITSFVERCIVEGETVSDAAPDISLKDLEYLCELLFIEGSKQNLEIRSLLKADFISIGRISDSAMFGWVILTLNPHLKCLKTMILSRKTGDIIPCSLMPSRRGWRACFFHFRGCQLILSEPGYKWIFPSIPK